MQFLILLGFAIALFAILFALQNPTPVLVNFFVWQFQNPLALVILVTLAMGVLAGLLLSMPAIVRRSWRIGGLKKQVEILGRQLQEREQEVSRQQQQTAVVQQSQRNLLSALAVAEPETGLLRNDSMPRTLDYLLQPPDHTTRSSVCVYLLEVSDPSNDLQSAPLARELQRAIASRLQAQAHPQSWLHHSEPGRFTCIATGLNAKTAAEFGETLRASIADPPLQRPDGSVVPLTVNAGGAIAPPALTITSTALLLQAEEALLQVKKRGQNRFRLVEVQS